MQGQKLLDILLLPDHLLIFYIYPSVLLEVFPMMFFQVLELWVVLLEPVVFVVLSEFVVLGALPEFLLFALWVQQVSRVLLLQVQQVFAYLLKKYL